MDREKVKEAWQLCNELLGDVWDGELADGVIRARAGIQADRIASVLEDVLGIDKEEGGHE